MSASAALDRASYRCIIREGTRTATTSPVAHSIPSAVTDLTTVAFFSCSRSPRKLDPR